LVERLRETRMFFQYATAREFCAPVEHIAVEMFLLHPEGYDGPSRIERADP
jgi:hypothetical protein